MTTSIPLVSASRTMGTAVLTSTPDVMRCRREKMPACDPPRPGRTSKVDSQFCGCTSAWPLPFFLLVLSRSLFSAQPLGSNNRPVEADSRDLVTSARMEHLSAATRFLLPDISNVFTHLIPYSFLKISSWTVCWHRIDTASNMAPSATCLCLFASVTRAPDSISNSLVAQEEQVNECTLRLPTVAGSCGLRPTAPSLFTLRSDAATVVERHADLTVIELHTSEEQPSHGMNLNSKPAARNPPTPSIVAAARTALSTREASGSEGKAIIAVDSRATSTPGRRRTATDAQDEAGIDSFFATMPGDSESRSCSRASPCSPRRHGSQQEKKAFPILALYYRMCVVRE
mmetsp:Transcript_48644/g.146646  ORF Transcript_48644/g.146646 Transcript_48644/m.146646 type:complete len:343 (-) Transcript_48644:33-1061(-)